MSYLVGADDARSGVVVVLGSAAAVAGEAAADGAAVARAEELFPAAAVALAAAVQEENGDVLTVDWWLRAPASGKGHRDNRRPMSILSPIPPINEARVVAAI